MDKLNFFNTGIKVNGNPIKPKTAASLKQDAEAIQLNKYAGLAGIDPNCIKLDGESSLKLIG